jgi:hypothetical protein
MCKPYRNKFETITFCIMNSCSFVPYDKSVSWIQNIEVARKNVYICISEISVIGKKYQ